jgi:uncharacterized protein (TIGR03546 family)
MLESLAKLLKVLNSETAPAQISLAFCFAMVAGLTPLMSLHNLLILLLVLVIRVNLSTFLLGLALFSAIAYLLDPYFHQLGFELLTNQGLQEFWTTLYNSAFWRLERFNNTIVLGSLLSSLVAFVPVLLITNFLIRRYREHVLTCVRKTRLMQMLKASKFFNLYKSVSGSNVT